MQLSIFRGLVAALALCAAGEALAGPGVTLGPINMRVAPRAGAPVIMAVPGDAQIDVEWCRDGLCPAAAATSLCRAGACLWVRTRLRAWRLRPPAPSLVTGKVRLKPLTTLNRLP